MGGRKLETKLEGESQEALTAKEGGSTMEKTKRHRMGWQTKSTSFL